MYLNRLNATLPKSALQCWAEARDIAISINYEPFRTSAQEEIDRLLGN